MAATGPTRDGVMADINVTPLVDVMLVLLVIFMVTAPLIQQGVNVDLPEAKAQAIASDQDKLILEMTRDGRLLLAGKEIPRAQLGDKLKFNAKVQKDRELFLQADKHIPYGDVVQVMAVCKEAGVEKLGMVTDSMEAPPEITR